MLESLDKLINNKVLAVYRCGSRVYDLSSEESDEDFTVIVEGDFLPNIIKDEGKDFFVYGVNQFKEAISFKDGYLSFFLIWLDNITIAEKNLVFIEEDFKEEFKQIVNVDWKDRFKPWLIRNLSYYDIRLEYSPDEKGLYNLFRLNSIVKHFLETGSLVSFFNEEDKKKAEDFKSNPSKREGYKETLQAIFSYLKQVVEEE